MKFTEPVRRPLSHCKRDITGMKADLVRLPTHGQHILLPAGSARKKDDVPDEMPAMQQGGGTGRIIGRDTFQRHRGEAPALLDQFAAFHRAGAA